MTAPGDANSLVVQNLRPGTRYKFRVAAENRHGISPESQAVTTRMLEEGRDTIVTIRCKMYYNGLYVRLS